MSEKATLKIKKYFPETGTEREIDTKVVRNEVIYFEELLYFLYVCIFNYLIKTI